MKTLSEAFSWILHPAPCLTPSTGVVLVSSHQLLCSTTPCTWKVTHLPRSQGVWNLSVYYNMAA